MKISPLRVTLRQLQIFTAVARTGSTTAAAEEIALSQSAASSALVELERLLSQPLFDRVGKRLQLNESGRLLLPRALALLDQARAVEGLFDDAAAQAHTVRFGASTTIGNYVVPRLIAALRRQEGAAAAPRPRAPVTIANTEAICRAVAAFELDIGLIEGPSHEPDLEVLPWVSDQLVIVAAARNPLARLERVDVDLLRECWWLMREAGSGTREATDALLLPQLGSQRCGIELGNSEAIKRAVAEDLGIACLSGWVVHDLVQAGQLVVLRSALELPPRPCFIVVHRDKHRSPALEHFLAQVQAFRP